MLNNALKPITQQWTGISRYALFFQSSVLVFYEWTNRLCMYKRLLTNHLHGKATEL